MAIIYLHLRKMPLKYRGMIPYRSGPRGYRAADTMVGGCFYKVAGTKNT